MSHQLVVGSTVIPYEVRESAQARAMKIVATPSGVEVVVPTGTPPDAVEAYVARKRRWVFDAVRELAARHKALLDSSTGRARSCSTAGGG